MMRYMHILAGVLVFCCIPGLLFAADPAEEMSATAFLASLHYQTGTVTLSDGVATLTVPESFRYIDREDTKRLLEDGWGNPDGSGTLGMLLPAHADPLSIEGWGVVITYEEDGYVSDEDAGEIDYNDLLAAMQEASEEENDWRIEQGYPAVNLIGWAEQPYYDAAAKKLYWAKELQFGDEAEHTLNYGVRILGRKGVLVMNAVADMGQLATVSERMPRVIGATEFNEGYRYAEFDPGIDKVAGYGIAALIGGKIAAKAGLLAKLGAVLLAMKKFIIIALAAIGGFFAKLFKGRKAAS